MEFFTGGAIPSDSRCEKIGELAPSGLPVYPLVIRQREARDAGLSNTDFQLPIDRRSHRGHARPTRPRPRGRHGSAVHLLDNTWFCSNGFRRGRRRIAEIHVAVVRPSGRGRHDAFRPDR